jgi:FlaG protein
MSLEIGPTPNVPGGRPPARSSATAPAGFAAALAASGPVDAAHVGVPAGPPPPVLDAVGVAADRAEQLAAEQRELHFEPDAATGRVIVQVRDLRTGEVLRTIPASKALDVLEGEDL